MAHSSEWLKFTAQDFTNISDNPLSDYTHIFQYFSDWIDSIQASTIMDTWRPIRVNGTEQKGSSISSGYINFGSDTNHNVVFSYSNNTIMANVGLSNYVPTSRKINDKALTSDITLTYSDVGAASSSHTHTINQITGLASTLTQLGSDIANRVSYDDVQPAAASDQTKIPTISYVENMIGEATSTITDTKNTTGALPSSSDLFLVGATTQSTNPVTYTNNGLKWYSNRAALQIQGAHTGAYYSADSVITYLTTATNTTHTFTWPDLSSLGTTAHTIPIQFQYKTATGQGTVSANSKGIVDLTGINFEAIEDVTTLPTGTAINEHKFYRTVQIGDPEVTCVPMDDTPFSNLMFNTSLSVSEVMDIITQDGIPYSSESVTVGGVSLDLLWYNICLNHDYSEDYGYAIVRVPSYNFAMIINWTFANYIQSGTVSGTPICLWNNDGTVASNLTGGLITFTGWNSNVTMPIAVIFYKNASYVNTAVANNLLTNLVWCTKWTSYKRVTEIYEAGSSTTISEQLKSTFADLWDNKLISVYNTVPISSAVWTGILNGTYPYIAMQDDTTSGTIGSIFAVHTATDTYAPYDDLPLYMFVALVDLTTASSPSITQSMIAPAEQILSTILSTQVGTITVDTELKKYVSLYHYKLGWNKVGEGDGISQLEWEILNNHISELEYILMNSNKKLTYIESNDTVIFSLEE